MGLLTAIDLLPPRQREAVIFRHGQGRTENDTARLMSVGARRVRRLIEEARHRLASRHNIRLPLIPQGRPPGQTLTNRSFAFDSI